MKAYVAIMNEIEYGYARTVSKNLNPKHTRIEQDDFTATFSCGIRCLYGIERKLNVGLCGRF